MKSDTKSWKSIIYTTSISTQFTDIVPSISIHLVCTKCRLVTLYSLISSFQEAAEHLCFIWSKTSWEKTEVSLVYLLPNHTILSCTFVYLFMYFCSPLSRGVMPLWCHLPWPLQHLQQHFDMGGWALGQCGGSTQLGWTVAFACMVSEWVSECVPNSAAEPRRQKGEEREKERETPYSPMVWL